MNDKYFDPYSHDPYTPPPTPEPGLVPELGWEDNFGQNYYEEEDISNDWFDFQDGIARLLCIIRTLDVYHLPMGMADKLESRVHEISNGYEHGFGEIDSDYSICEGEIDIDVSGFVTYIGAFKYVYEKIVEKINKKDLQSIKDMELALNNQLTKFETLKLKINKLEDAYYNAPLIEV